ncbi:MAG TPA: hypothetical protein PK514_06525 [Spirochaetota bacterium]|nr:hypothetical protein [Spirochaetota bacterium]
MSLLSEMGDSLIKYGEILISKTEDFTRTARIRIEIRKKEIEINNIKIIIADHVIAQTHKKAAIDAELVNARISAINSLNLEITGLKVRLEELKNQSNAPESDKNGTEPGTLKE